MKESGWSVSRLAVVSENFMRISRLLRHVFGLALIREHHLQIYNTPQWEWSIVMKMSFIKPHHVTLWLTHFANRLMNYKLNR